MSRRSQWKEVRNAMVGSNKMGKTVEEKEKMPEKACGTCKNFSESTREGDGRGSCTILKMGSDLRTDPPKLVTEGSVGYISYLNTDGDKCTHYAKMPMIDKDGGETSDPFYRRTHRQMDKV